MIKPNFGCSTKNIYKKVNKFSKPVLNDKFIKSVNRNTLKYLKNDLEQVAFNQYPKLKKLVYFLENLKNTEFVRMTGSGSTIIAYFKTKNATLNAAKVIKKKYKNYWCMLSKTI